jgi:hypothetical protein
MCEMCLKCYYRKPSSCQGEDAPECGMCETISTEIFCECPDYMNLEDGK